MILEAENEMENRRISWLYEGLKIHESYGCIVEFNS